MTKSEVAQANVLDAAGRLFRRQGFAATTVREIAKEAGILPGSLHYRYPTKDEVLLALMEDGVRAVRSAVEAAVAASEDPFERLRLGLRAHLKALLADSDSVHAVLWEWRSVQGPAREALVRLRNAYEEYWDELLYDALETGRGRHVSDVRLIRLFGFGAINWVSTWYRPGKGLSPEQIADAFFAFIAFGVVADDQRPEGVDELFKSLVLPLKKRRAHVSA